MGVKNIYERFIWFDSQVREKKYPNTTALANRFETSIKTAQRDIDFMRDRLYCPLDYDSSQKGYHYGDNTFTLPMVYLSSGELSSLLVARKILQDVGGGYLDLKSRFIQMPLRLSSANLLKRWFFFLLHLMEPVSVYLWWWKEGVIWQILVMLANFWPVIFYLLIKTLLISMCYEYILWHVKC